MSSAARQPSLQRTLLLWLLPALALLVPLGALLIYRIALIPALDALDRALTDTTVALDLQLLVALRDHGSLHAAAEALSLTQPSLSKMLKEIELSFGRPLF